MTQEPRWRRYLRFFGYRGVADLDDELRFHIEMRVRDYMARGMSEAEARAATAQRLGDLATARDTCTTIATRRERRVTRSQIIDALMQDVRFGFRFLLRQKAWTAVAVLTLALGIGATSAMFSVVNHLLLNPMPYPDADRVVLVSQQPSLGAAPGNVSVTLLPMGRVVAQWRDQNRSFESLEPYVKNDVTIQRPGEPARIVRTAEVLPSFAQFAARRPIAGRMFTDAEAKGEANVVVLSEALWRGQYAADPKAIGTTLTVNEKPATIVGVMPAGFRLPLARDRDIALWLPLDLARRNADGLFAVGRLRPGMTRATAASDLDSIAGRDAANRRNNSRFAANLAGPADEIRFQDSLIMLSVAVALVLLIACANVAHLLLARASTRRREMAIRVAVGAGSERLFRQLLTESMILSLAGCLGGLLIAWVGLRVLLVAKPESLSELGVARMDGMTLLVTMLLSVVTGIAFGLVGAMQARRYPAHDALKAGSLTSSEGRTQGRARGLLVVTEMALCTSLLIGAALLLRSVIHLQNRELGFEAKNLYALNVHLPQERYTQGPAVAAFFDELSIRMRGVPGVEGVARASAGPLGMSFSIGALQLEGQPDPPAGTSGFVPYNKVDTNFFALMGLRLVEGTTFTDTSAAAAQVLVNEGFVRKHWPRQMAVGRKLRIVYNGQGEWKTVIGVASNALTQGLAADPGAPLIYMPGRDAFSPTLIVRTTGDAGMLPRLAGIVTSIDAKLPPSRIGSVELAMQKSIAGQRFTMFLLLIFTTVAVGLAAVGLYGVLAYSVSQRTREIGIRIALGASRRAIARSIMSQGLLLAGIGAVVGVVAARWGVRLVATMLYGVRQTDSVSFTGSAVVLLLVATVACLVPMRRALSVDPLIAMKAD